MILYSSLDSGTFILEQATFSSLSIRHTTSALHGTLNIYLNYGSNYKAGLKQGIDLRVSFKIGY